MALAQGRGGALVVIFALVCLGGALSSAGALQHAVGGSAGWSLPKFVNVNYTTWAENQTFTAGDTLLFKYNSTVHNVEEVSKTDYKNCTTDKPMSKYSDGNTVIHLNKSGSYYFICGVDSHCALGQKFMVKVLAASKSAAPSPSPGTSSSKSPVPSPSSNPSPSAVSSAPSVSAATPPPAGLVSAAVSMKSTVTLGVGLAALIFVPWIC